MAATRGKHGSCIRHDKLAGCGCKVCVRDGSTALTAPDELAAFHAYIHAAYAAYMARPRLAGDGRVGLGPEWLHIRNESIRPIPYSRPTYR